MFFDSAKVVSESQEEGSNKTELFLVGNKDKDVRDLIKEARKHGFTHGAESVTLTFSGRTVSGQELSVSFAPEEAVDDIHSKYLSAIESRAFSYKCARPAEQQPVPATAPLQALKA